MNKKKILILGSTGSIGTQTLDIIRHYPDRFEIVGLCANRSYKLLNEQIEEFSPQYIGLASCELRNKLTAPDAKTYFGEQGIINMCHECGADLVVCAMVGLAGLKSTVACIKEGMTIALANKETLVGGGHLVMNLAKEYNVDIYPVDSEHSAIFQCLQNEANTKGLKKIYITASGGPFFATPKEEMESITIEQALNHPNWSMGAKITIDSATMMNKGLEVIEAKYLFDLDVSQIQVAIHRKSIVHSMVEFTDNSVLAQLGNPDMKIPIQYALMYPERLDCPTNELDIFSMGALEFFPPDMDKFPCLRIAYDAISDGSCRAVVVNAANEIAVDGFLNGKIGFTDIYKIIEKAYYKIDKAEETDLDLIVKVDRATREYCRSLIKE